ncbi:protein FAM174C [Elgaria multicarinata webbii]|uniref:protein FAM174C n=1 Tax=Elgaria multicarinata webbii TaxID=159646 RepID=UPI002FCCF104
MAAARLALLSLVLWAAAATTTDKSTSAEAATTPLGPKSPGHQPALPPAGPSKASKALPPPPPPPSGFGLPALHRALYVLAGVAGIGLLYYLGGRALRTRKPPRKKYGLLSNSDDHMEMGSVESDEDTVFETRRLRR